jgi:hypothetical protein
MIRPYDVKKRENSQEKFENFGLFWPILATFYEFKSHFEKSW